MISSMRYKSKTLLAFTALCGLGLGVGLSLVIVHRINAGLINGLVGLWQFPDVAVWIRVKPDGTFLQCRSTHGMFVALGTAELTANREINWDVAEWGTETVSSSDGKLRLSRPDKVDIYTTPTRQPGPECQSKLGLD
jgi:hypothetical protein